MGKARAPVRIPRWGHPQLVPPGSRVPRSSLRGLQLRPRWAPSEIGCGVRCPWYRWGPRKGPGHLVGPSPRSGICPGLAGTLCPFPRFSSVHVSKPVALGAPGVLGVGLSCAPGSVQQQAVSVGGQAMVGPPSEAAAPLVKALPCPPHSPKPKEFLAARAGAKGLEGGTATAQATGDTATPGGGRGGEDSGVF